VRVSLKY